MATYAAFKHVELYNVGNTKKRVLKPPGGGSSDIFGGNIGHDTPRSGNKTHFASNIFAQPEAVSNNGLTPRRGRNNDSHNRLFGEPDRSVTPAKNHLKSNIPIGGDETDRKSSVSSVPSKTSVISNGHTNGKMENGSHQHISNGNGTKESEDTRPLGEQNEQQELDNLDTRSLRSHKSTESVLLANNSNKEHVEVNNNHNEINHDNNEVNHDNNDTGDNKSEISIENKTINNDSSDTLSIKVPDVNVSRMQNNNVFGDGNNQTNLKSGRRNMESRNCVTGVGIESPQYSARKFGSRRGDGGNPITGEGYTGSRNGLDSSSTQVKAVSGSNQVINKNRVPPGGFSSGLW